MSNYHKNPGEKFITPPFQYFHRLINVIMSIWSGKTTRSLFLAFTDQGVVSATNFFTGVIIGRVCTKDQFGLYMLGFSIVLFGMEISSALITRPYTVYSPRLKDGKQTKYAGSTLFHQFSLSVLLIFVLIIASVVFSFGVGPQGLSSVTGTLALVITFILFRDYARRTSFANLKVKHAFIIDFFVGIIQVAGLLLLCYFELLSADHAYLIIGLACFISSSVWFIKEKKFFSLIKREVFFHFQKNWTIGKWLFGGCLVILGSNQAYPWILANFHGTSATAILSACNGIVAIPGVFLIAILNFLGPKISHILSQGNIFKLRRTVLTCSLLIALAMGFLFFLILVYGDFIVSFIYGNKYSGNINVLIPLFLSQTIIGIKIPVECGLVAMERSDAGFKGYLSALFVTILAGPPLVKFLGTVGAAYGILISNLIAALIQFVIYIRHLNLIYFQVKSYEF